VRLVQKDLRLLLKNKHLSVQSEFGGAVGGAQVRNAFGRSADSDVGCVIESIETSQVEVEYLHGHLFSSTFHGASLLSLNKLLRLDHRTGELKRYRAACHNAAERAVRLVEQRYKCKRMPMPEGLAVSLYRSGVKPFDNDALVASNKFLIDGFRCAGLIKEDDPSHIASFDKLVQRCGVGEPLSIGIAFCLSQQ